MVSADDDGSFEYCRNVAVGRAYYYTSMIDLALDAVLYPSTLLALLAHLDLN